MPTYVYKFVETGETIEVQQSFTDDTLTEITHPDSGKAMAVKKVFQPVGVTFKGSGFFKTDSRGSTSSSSAATSGEGGSGSGESSSSTTPTSESSGSSSKSSDSKKSTTPTTPKKSSD